MVGTNHYRSVSEAAPYIPRIRAHHAPRVHSLSAIPGGDDNNDSDNTSEGDVDIVLIEMDHLPTDQAKENYCYMILGQYLTSQTIYTAYVRLQTRLHHPPIQYGEPRRILNINNWISVAEAIHFLPRIPGGYVGIVDILTCKSQDELLTRSKQFPALFFYVKLKQGLITQAIKEEHAKRVANGSINSNGKGTKPASSARDELKGVLDIMKSVRAQEDNIIVKAVQVEMLRDVVTAAFGPARDTQDNLGQNLNAQIAQREVIQQLEARNRELEDESLELKDKHEQFGVLGRMLREQAEGVLVVKEFLRKFTMEKLGEGTVQGKATEAAEVLKEMGLIN